MGTKEQNLWEEIGNECLRKAQAMLHGSEIPSAETAAAIRSLVEAAIAIDQLNLQWAMQTRSGAAVYRGKPF